MGDEVEVEVVEYPVIINAKVEISNADGAVFVEMHFKKDADSPFLQLRGRLYSVHQDLSRF